MQREFEFRGSQEDEREIPLLSGSQPSSPYVREAFSKTVRRVSWVEMTRREASRSRVSSR
jgi:hypothetical protein